MFSRAVNFDGGGLDVWKVWRLRYAVQMFFRATSFNQDLCSWRTRLPLNSNFYKAFHQTQCAYRPEFVDSVRTGPYCARCIAPATLSEISSAAESLSMTISSDGPSQTPSISPSQTPSISPSQTPSNSPSQAPTQTPTTLSPTGEPSLEPSTSSPSREPSPGPILTEAPSDPISEQIPESTPSPF
jgi:Mycoplasma protein of unknown function, DUF285